MDKRESNLVIHSRKRSTRCNSPCSQKHSRKRRWRSTAVRGFQYEYPVYTPDPTHSATTSPSAPMASKPCCCSPATKSRSPFPSILTCFTRNARIGSWSYFYGQMWVAGLRRRKEGREGAVEMCHEGGERRRGQMGQQRAEGRSSASEREL